MHEAGVISLTKYRETLRHREARTQRRIEERRTRAWDVARYAASLLYDQFNASRVVLFGSLVHEMWFSTTSDIDLAAWDIADEDYFVAVAKLQELATDFKIDLISMKRCKPHLQEIIEREGVRL